VEQVSRVVSRKQYKTRVLSLDLKVERELTIVLIKFKRIR